MLQNFFHLKLKQYNCSDMLSIYYTELCGSIILHISKHNSFESLRSGPIEKS